MTGDDGLVDKIIADLQAQGSETSGKAPTFVTRLNQRRQVRETLVERENREIIEMRRLWSHWILIFIGLIVIFDILLVSFYGLGYWSFADPAVVIAVITDNFLKIFGLGFLITQRLFAKIFNT